MHTSKAQKASLTTIKKRTDFLKIQSKGSKWVSHGLILQSHTGNTDNTRRIGFTVSKKTDKSAVKRNRIKRRLRAIAADILPLHAKEGQDYILVGRPATLTRPYEALCKDLIWCLKKMDLHL